MTVAEQPDAAAELIPIAEAVRRFGLSRTTLRAAMADGKLHCYERPLGKQRLFVDAREIESQLQPRPVEVELPAVGLRGRPKG